MVRPGGGIEPAARAKPARPLAQRASAVASARARGCVKQRVPDAAAGERLDRFLASLPEIGSRGLAERVLAAGVLVDGRREAKSHRLGGGEEVEFEPPAQPAPGLAAEEMELRIAYEDEHLVVVDKPAGLVVHPAPGHPTGTLVHGLLSRDVAGGDGERPGIVHRLDRDTSGLIVVARSEEAHRRLQRLVRRRELARHYLALVVGRPRSRSGRIEAAIGRDRRDPMRHSLDTDTPREAITHFTLVELLPRHALLDVRLETGRTHQIRVHLAAIDLPVAGDAVYGRSRELGLERQFLHAARLVFMHPFTRERLEVESPLPGDLAAALDRARG
jgi:23S rRNA pseudouridine1911/1915/1917 synthase